MTGQDDAARVIDGYQVFGSLQVTWRAIAAPRSELGWVVHCGLRLDEADSQETLDDQTPSRPFYLDNGREVAWGRLNLRRDAGGRFAVLYIDYHTGPASEQSLVLCNWRVCQPCDQVAPVDGEKVFGSGGKIKATWTIAGSDEACLAITLRVGLLDEPALATHTLTPQAPSWRKSFTQDDALVDCHFVLQIAADGVAQTDAVLHYAHLPSESVELAHFPVASPSPVPAPAHTPGNAVIFARPREFAAFVYPRGLQPPSAAQSARRFNRIGNSGAFQDKLASLHASGDRAGMLAEARDFVSPDSKNYPGQYVRQISALKTPMNRLVGPPVRALLALHPVSLDGLRAAVTALLGEPIDVFLKSEDYPGQLAQLQDSLVALLVLGVRDGDRENALIQALLVCHVAVLIENAPGVLDTPEALREPLQASPLLPAAIFPLPPVKPAAGEGATADAARGYVKPLGFADLNVIKQRLVRYRLGDLAYVENVMRGESKERAEHHRRQMETDDDDTLSQTDGETHEQDYNGRARTVEQTVANPLNDLKREFDSLKKDYGTDGLSVTVTGGWTDTLDGPKTLDNQAAAYARNLLDRAAARVARRIGSERSRRSVEEFSEHNIRRFHNEEGVNHVIGVYRWIDEVHTAHLEHRGSRLVLECVMASPAADYVRRNNVLHGMNVTAPIPPWIGDGQIAPIYSAADITRDNYAALAARYSAAAVEPPPPQSEVVSAALSSDPPRASARLAVPPGYVAASALVSYGWTPRPAPAQGTAVTPALDVLVGGAALKIDPTQDPNPGAKPLSSLPSADAALPVAVISAGVDYVVNLAVTCTCPDDAAVFQHWQMATYDAVMSAYTARQHEYYAVMERYAADFAHQAAARRREVEYGALQKTAIQILIGDFLLQEDSDGKPQGTPPAWCEDVVNFNLIPFFRRALEWAEMTYTFYGDYFASDDANRPAWLTMIQAKDERPGFHEFLQAAAARLLVAVQPDEALQVLFYLASGGRFWFGEAALTPVHMTDMWLVNALKSLAREPFTEPDSPPWEVEVATSHLMLQDDARLPDYREEPAADPVAGTP